MNKILFLVVVCSMTLFGDIKWSENYVQGMKEASESGKIMMVMLSKEDCPACWYMENVVFENEAVMKRINANFINVHLDIHKDNLEGLDFIGTPTIYFLDARGQKISRIDGAANVKDFTSALNALELK